MKSISYSCVVILFSHLQLFATLWTGDHQAPLSTGFSWQEYWSGLPCPPPGHLPDSGIKPKSLNLLHWQVGSLPLAPPEKPCVCVCVCVCIERSIYTSIFPPSWTSFPHSPHTTYLGHHRAQSWDPCAIEQIPINYLLYTWLCTCINLQVLNIGWLPCPEAAKSVHQGSSHHWLLS